MFEDGLRVESLQASVTAGARPVLLAVLGAVLVLLVIACANVTNLVLARSVGRRSALAVSAALGARRARLVRQLLTESLVLALLGGVAGLALAFAALSRSRRPACRASTPLASTCRRSCSRWRSLRSPVSSSAPALRGTRPNLSFDLHVGARATGGSQHVLRRTLVVTEIALALVLLAGAGLLFRSVERLLDARERPGSPEAVLLSESFAKRRFGERSPIGERVRLGPEIGRLDHPWDGGSSVYFRGGRHALPTRISHVDLALGPASISE